MNKTLLAITTTMLLAGASAPGALAQDAIYYDDEIVYANGDMDGDGIANENDGNDDRYDYSGNRVRFEIGSYLPADYLDSSYYVDYRIHGMRAPPYGHQWHRVGSNVYLVSTNDGYIADLIYNLIR